MPAHRQPAYAQSHRFPLPLTERLHAEVLSLPLHPALDETAVERVIAACRAFKGAA